LLLKEDSSATVLMVPIRALCSQKFADTIGGKRIGMSRYHIIFSFEIILFGGYFTVFYEVFYEMFTVNFGDFLSILSRLFGVRFRS